MFGFRANTTTIQRLENEKYAFDPSVDEDGIYYMMPVGTYTNVMTRDQLQAELAKDVTKAVVEDEMVYDTQIRTFMPEPNQRTQAKPDLQHPLLKYNLLKR
jgi:hypothetical protein